MPTEAPDSTFREKVKIKAYPAQEFGGLIWIYMGPSHLLPELPQFEWARVGPSQRVVSRWLQDSNYLQAAEGARELQAGHEPLAPHHGDLYRVRPVDVVSEEGDFGKLYEQHADLAVART